MNIPYLVHLSLSAGAFQVYPISCYPNRHVGLINIVKAYDTSQNNLTNWSNTSSPGVDMKISKQYAVKKYYLCLGFLHLVWRRPKELQRQPAPFNVKWVKRKACIGLHVCNVQTDLLHGLCLCLSD